jgi:hypothetical protein
MELQRGNPQPNAQNGNVFIPQISHQCSWQYPPAQSDRTTGSKGQMLAILNGVPRRYFPPAGGAADRARRFLAQPSLFT